MGAARLRKWTWVIVTFIVILMVGGYAFSRHQSIEKQYHVDMENAAAAINDENYSAAETYFQAALTRRNNDSVATHRLRQTKVFVTAMSQLENHRFSTSKKTFAQVYKIHHGSKVLNLRAHEKITEIGKVQKNITKYNKVIKYARELNEAQEFSLSNVQLDSLFNTKEFKKGYYTSLWKTAKQIQKSNKTGLSQAVMPGSTSSSAQSPSSNNSSADNTTTGATSGSSNSNGVSSLPAPNLSSSEKQAADNYSGSNEYTVTKKDTELNGKVITQAQINAARQELGTKSNQFSDQDIRNIIKEAAQKGISVSEAAQ